MMKSKSFSAKVTRSNVMSPLRVGMMDVHMGFTSFL